jgi:hypothetical protein
VLEVDSSQRTLLEMTSRVVIGNGDPGIFIDQSENHGKVQGRNPKQVIFNILTYALRR